MRKFAILQRQKKIAERITHNRQKLNKEFFFVTLLQFVSRRFNAAPFIQLYTVIIHRFFWIHFPLLRTEIFEMFFFPSQLGGFSCSIMTIFPVIYSQLRLKDTEMFGFIFMQASQWPVNWDEGSFTKKTPANR